MVRQFKCTNINATLSKCFKYKLESVRLYSPTSWLKAKDITSIKGIKDNKWKGVVKFEVKGKKDISVIMVYLKNGEVWISASSEGDLLKKAKEIGVELIG